MALASLSPRLLLLLLMMSLVQQAESCGPGGGLKRRSPRKLTPLVYKQHVPNTSETALAASGPPEGAISRTSQRYTSLVTNTDPNIVFRDNTGSTDDRLMSQRLKDKLQTLAIAVMNHWSDQPSLRLRVTLAWHEGDLQQDDVDSSHDALHLEGRAADITTSDRDRSKYGMLARLAVEAGFDWVYMESRGHVHVSVKSETSLAVTTGGCFHGNGQVYVEKRGSVPMSDLTVGDRVLALDLDTNTLVYSNVILFMHLARDVTAVFTHAHTANGHSVTLTASHLLYVTKNDSTDVIMFADTLKPNDFLLTVPSPDVGTQSSDVTNVTSVVRRGLYAPVTQHGTIVVDGVVTSCYALIDSHVIAHAVFAPIRWYWTLTSLLSADQSAASVEKVGHHDLWPRQSDLDLHWYAQALYTVGYWLVPEQRRL